jgi:protoporphyrin/coproporphyrin ferrochelatase
MKAGVILLNFGEPAQPVPEEVVPFLERIFLQNASLETAADADARRRRAHELAERRAPGLIAEYKAIGGSPLRAQTEWQAQAVAQALRRRGYDVATWVGNQFTDPSIPDAVAEAQEAGVEVLVGLPVYPLCGPSTNVAAAADMRAAVEAAGWDVVVHEITGWHRHPDYAALRAAAIESAAEAAGFDLGDPETRLVFSAHGTPVKFLESGSRYADYVVEHCARVAELAGVETYALGYQNHGNRPIEWTQPAIDAVIRELDAKRVVVVPVSFVHEQSETLSELDIELREEAEAAGLEFCRVPTPHDDDRFIAVLADLVEPLLGDANPAGLEYRTCHCRGLPGAICLNAEA